MRMLKAVAVGVMSFADTHGYSCWWGLGILHMNMIIGGDLVFCI